MHKKKEIKSLDGNSLSKTIKQETISYLKKMNGTGVSNLHNLFVSETEKILISTVLDFLGGNVTILDRIHTEAQNITRNMFLNLGAEAGAEETDYEVD